MAMEYLKDDYFTLASDVWSYGVLLWEILSFGNTPYGKQDYDEILEKLEKGYRLPCPIEVEDVSSWSPKIFYNELSTKCFHENPNDRASFSDIVQSIETQLFSNEKGRYSQTSELYERNKASNYLRIGNR